ncbi:hypothetical protein C1J03_05360 [Sulfitobacter sp. SK012]|nr:hypothetical protein C1J03_05360 [Sulfitobacter sp. SK012]
MRRRERVSSQAKDQDNGKDHARIREANSMCLASVFRSFVDIAQEMMRSIWLNSSLDARLIQRVQ